MMMDDRTRRRLTMAIAIVVGLSLALSAVVPLLTR